MLRLAFGLWLLSSLSAFAGYGPTVTPEEVRREFTYRRALVTGTVEGVTEYLPVSSTGHMIISDTLLGVPKYPDVTVAGLADRKGRAVSLERIADDYIVIIQLGAILAVFVAFFGRISTLVSGLCRWESPSVELAQAIIVAFIPAALLGFLFKDAITAYLFSVEVVAAALLVGGLVILVAEHLLPQARAARSDEVAAIGWRSALTVGLCQCFALIPGTSRSLATILGGRLAGLSHAAATEFSFLVGLLTLSAASVYKMWSLGPALTQVYPAGPASVGLLIAAVTAFVSVKWLVGYVSRNGLGVFAWYRIALGGVILAILALK
ncbi:MAG: undecaprenyl-diphosphate phosphatase [Verrucomicrobia bacterium]|nr:undecaprenyl-diphosphate phosphatase [Verrucomicrobiota bacterium]